MPWGIRYVCLILAFGLGMSAAARGALLLGRQFDQADGAVSAPAFQRELALLNIVPWQLVTGCDMDGKPLSRDIKLLRRLYAMAPSRPEVAHALLAMQHIASTGRNPHRACIDMRIAVLGGGTAGFIAACHLTRSLPHVELLHVFDTRIPTIGVGEGTTPRFCT